MDSFTLVDLEPNVASRTFGAATMLERHASPAQSSSQLHGHSHAMSDLLLAGLDSLAHGVAIVDIATHWLYANAAARAALAEAGWAVQDGALRSPRLKEQTAWNEALRQVCERGMRQLFEWRTADGSSYVALAPVSAHGRRCAFVTFGRRELCGAIELQMFSSRYNLTYAENQVLCGLVSGLKPAEIAKAHGVALSTVLTQVAAIRSKTLSSSVRQLLARLSRMPPLRLPTFNGGASVS